MAITHTLAWNYTASNAATSANLSASSESEQNLDIVVPALSTDYQVAFVLDYSQCKGFFIMADATMTVETNATDAAGGQTISLTSGVPVAWIYGSGTCPITADITKIYVTSTAGGNLTIRSLVDATV